MIDYRVPKKHAWKESEHLFQVLFFAHAAQFAADHPEILLMHAIPNGGWRGKHVGVQLKAEGVITGVPDICLPLARGGFHGFYLELKKYTGSVSPEQWAFLEKLEQGGYFAAVTNSLSVAVKLLSDYLNA